MGRPSFTPTAEQRTKVDALAQVRTSLEEIARQVGVSKKTLLKHFAAELGREAVGEKSTKQGKTPPPFDPSPEQRQAVEMLAASDIMSREAIAARLGITVEMLEHHFADELSNGPARQLAETIIATKKAADAGNVSAQRLWYTITGSAVKSVNKGKAAPMGKKEQATAVAQRALSSGGRFAPLAPPKLVVNNEK